MLIVAESPPPASTHGADTDANGIPETINAKIAVKIYFITVHLLRYFVRPYSEGVPARIHLTLVELTNPPNLASGYLFFIFANLFAASDTTSFTVPKYMAPLGQASAQAVARVLPNFLSLMRSKQKSHFLILLSVVSRRSIW